MKKMRRSPLRPVIGVGVISASAAVLAMMLIGAGDVVSTYLGYPISGAHELIKMLMVLVVFLALPEVEVHDRHIAIDMVRRRLPAGVQEILVVISKLLGLFFFGAMAWQAWKLFWRSWLVREYASGFIAFPVYPTKAIYALGITVATFVALVGLLALLARAMSRVRRG